MVGDKLKVSPWFAIMARLTNVIHRSMFISSLSRTKKVAFSFSTDVFSKLYEYVTYCLYRYRQD